MSLTYSLNGLTTKEVIALRLKFGYNQITKKENKLFGILLKQFKNVFNLILIITSIFSFLAGDITNGSIILAMILLSGILGFVNEYKSDQSIKKLAKAVKFHSIVMRDGTKQEVDSEELVPGDLIYFENGTVIPADIELISSTELQTDESALTGESFPVDKDVDKNNIVRMGTIVVNGSGTGVIKYTANETEYGKIAKSLDQAVPQTSFEKGITGFSLLIFRVILVMSIFIFISNAIFKQDILQALLFSLAIAIGLTPELLPAVITVSLANGMKQMLKEKVVVKQLSAIEDFGNMDILCTDKTGTLTEGKVELGEIVPRLGYTLEEILSLSLLCNTAVLTPILKGNPIDMAIWDYALKNNQGNITNNYKKISEVPFNYTSRCMYSLVENDSQLILIVKGAPEEVLKLCANSTNEQELASLQVEFQNYNYQGKRTIALATKLFSSKDIKVEAEREFTIKGLINLYDKPKESAKSSIIKLKNLGVDIKILTGDNEIITAQICKLLDLEVKGIITGPELEKLSPAEFKNIADKSTVFAKVTPDQKAQIIKALKELNYTVGYLGDGVNDAVSLKVSDVGITVDTGVDVAKEVADIVLLDKNLDVLAKGIIEGRKTFANTTKYILMNISSNFGNMFSMAGASLILPFLPMLPGQILLNNLLYDTSQLALPSDTVDEDNLLKPNQWDIKFIQRFMLVFGPISSVFDYLTFGVLLNIFHANQAFFHTGWFLESIATQTFVVFVIRTKMVPFFKSKISWQLALLIFTIVGVAILITFSEIGRSFGFIALPMAFFIYLIIAVTSYLVMLEIIKYLFYKSITKPAVEINN